MKRYIAIWSLKQDNKINDIKSDQLEFDDFYNAMSYVSITSAKDMCKFAGIFDNEKNDWVCIMRSVK